MSAMPEFGAMLALVDGPVAQAVGWALVQFAWQGALLGAATALILAALRRSAPDVRYVVATIALCLMATLPVVTVWQELERASAGPPASTALPTSEQVGAGSPRSMSSVRASVAEDSAIATLDRNGQEAVAPDDSTAAGAGRWRSVAGFLVIAWAAGVLLLTLRLITGWLAMRSLTMSGVVPAREVFAATAARLARRLHVSRPVRLLESSLVEVPTVIGWLKPVVLLPGSVLAGLSPAQVEAILAHELAHIRRHDFLVNVLQAVVETLLFYHPAVWWVSKQIRVERENCCDDMAVGLCGDPLVYAQALADLEGLRASSHISPALTVAADGGSLVARVRRLLGPSHAAPGPGWIAGVCSVVLVVTLAGVAAGAIDRQDGRTTAALAADGVDQPRSDDEDVRAPAPRAMEHLREAVRTFVRDIQRGTHEFLMALHDAVPQVPPPPPLPPMPPAQSELPAPPAPPAPPVPLASSHVVPPAPLPPPPPPAFAQPVQPALPGPPPPPPAAIGAVPPAIVPVSPVIAPVPPAPPGLFHDGPRAAPETPPLPAPPVAPATAPPAPVPAPGQPLRRSQSGNFVWQNDDDKLEVHYRGEIEFTDDDADVKSLSPDGWLRIRQHGHGLPRGGYEVEFRADAAGSIERRFRVGGSERPFDPEGRKWLAANLPRIIRQSGIGAAARTARIYKSGGAKAVLSEISLIEGSWAKRVYFNALFATPGLDLQAVQPALAQAGREIDSDFELATLLISVNGRFPLDEGARRAFFEAARSIGSDFELRRVLIAGVQGGSMDRGQLASVLDTATSIQSDFEVATLLLEIAGRQPLDGPVQQPFFKAAATIESDFEHRRVLAAVAKRGDVSASALEAVLESAAAGLGSDFENASLLMQVADAHAIEGSLRDPFFRAAGTIASSFERGRVLQAVAKRRDASDQTLVEAIRATGSMGHFDAAQVLLAVASSRSLSGSARDAYFDAAGRLGAYEQGRALSALASADKRR